MTFKENMESKELSQLPYFLSNLENKLYMLKKSGESSRSNKWQKTINKRNIIRKILLVKLNEWKDNDFNSKPIYYSDVINNELISIDL